MLCTVMNAVAFAGDTAGNVVGLAMITAGTVVQVPHMVCALLVETVGNLWDAFFRNDVGLKSTLTLQGFAHRHDGRRRVGSVAERRAAIDGENSHRGGGGVNGASTSRRNSSRSASRSSTSRSQGGASSWEKNLLRTRRDKKDQMWREICEEIARQKTTGRDDNRSPLWLLGGARSEILRLLKCTGLFWEADSA